MLVWHASIPSFTVTQFPCCQDSRQVGTPHMNAIELENISRAFTTKRGENHVLQGISFHVKAGETVALLGDNGAGKTTLTRILATLLRPTSGRASINGYDVVSDSKSARKETGIVFGGDRGLYSQLSATENLQYFATLSGQRTRGMSGRVRESLEAVGLSKAGNNPVGTYSKGMKQRLHLAIGLFGNPSVLLLDEPTVGLDPIEADRFRQRIATLKTLGVSVLLTSHQLLDVDELADRILVLDKGQIVRDLSRDELSSVAGYAAKVTLSGKGPLPNINADTIKYAHLIDSISEECGWHIHLTVTELSEESLTEVGRLRDQLHASAMTIDSVAVEDIYETLVHGKQHTL